MTAFFDHYPRFQSTSYVGASANRLNKRHRAIIESNRELLAGARVLDLASHDGRWSFAALQAGAAHVTGIEARPELVARAGETFAAYGVAPDRFRFVAGELPGALGREALRADVVLLLGFLYHTWRHVELLQAIEETGARHVIVDTAVFSGPPEASGPVVELRREIVDSHANQAVPDRPDAGEAVVGYPSRAAVLFLFDYFGFAGEEYDWAPLLAEGATDTPDVTDYRGGGRATFRMTRRRP